MAVQKQLQNLVRKNMEALGIFNLEHVARISKTGAIGSLSLTTHDRRCSSQDEQDGCYSKYSVHTMTYAVPMCHNTGYCGVPEYCDPLKRACMRREAPTTTATAVSQEGDESERM